MKHRSERLSSGALRRLGSGLLSAGVLATTMLSASAQAQSDELVLSIGTRGYGAAVDGALESFKASHPDVDIEWQKVSDVPGESRKLFVTSLTARSPTPDVFAIDIIWAGEFARRGWLLPLGERLDEQALASYNQSFLDAATVDGEVFAAPLYVDGTHLFYRSDLLEKYGLSVPSTWEELLAASQTIMDGEGNPQFYGFVSMWAKIEGLFMNWLSFTNANGGGFTDADGNVAVNSAANVEATQFMVDLLHEHRVAPDSILTMRPDDARTLFQQGRAAFLMVQDFVHTPLSAPDSPVAGKFDFTRNPYFDGHDDAHSTALGGWLLAVNANTENPEAAVDLVEHFTSYERQLEAALTANRAPGRGDVYEDPAMADAGILARLGENFEVGVVRPSAETGNLYPRVSDAMQIAITEALQQAKPVQEALDNAQAEIESILAD